MQSRSEAFSSNYESLGEEGFCEFQQNFGNRVHEPKLTKETKKGRGRTCLAVKGTIKL